MLWPIAWLPFSYPFWMFQVKEWCLEPISISHMQDVKGQIETLRLVQFPAVCSPDTCDFLVNSVTAWSREWVISKALQTGGEDTQFTLLWQWCGHNFQHNECGDSKVVFQMRNSICWLRIRIFWHSVWLVLYILCFILITFLISVEEEW